MSILTPVIKPSIEFCAMDSKVMFFKNPGSAIEMDDKSGFVYKACKLMDGIKNSNDLISELSISHPKQIEFFPNLLIALNKEKLLEDTSINDATILSDYDLERWQRNYEFFGSYLSAEKSKYELQKKLQKTKVTLLGLGGAGSHILYDLAALGILNIQIVDFDRIELSNLNRQILYNDSDIGRLKSEVAKEKILQFLPKANIKSINQKICSSDDIKNLIKGQDIVISVIDQPREKIIGWVNQACVEINIPFICGAFDWKWALLYSVIPGKTGCIECWKSSSRNSTNLFCDILENDNFVPGKSLNVATSPFIAILTGLILTDLVKMITGISEPSSSGCVKAFDFATTTISTIEHWSQNPNCSTCCNARSSNE